MPDPFFAEAAHRLRRYEMALRECQRLAGVGVTNSLSMTEEGFFSDIHRIAATALASGEEPTNGAEE